MNVKKMIAAISVIMAVSSSVCACQSSDLPVETKAESELYELKIGVDILNPFFYIDENGNYAGIDAEIAQEACKRAGYTPEFVEITWSKRDTYLDDESVDCMWNAFVKNGREDLYRWTDAYLQSNLRAIVDTRSPDINVESLSDHASMAVRVGSKIEEFLKGAEDRPPIKIYACGTFEMAETAFVKGYIGALGGHEIVLQKVIEEYPEQYRFLDGTMLCANLGVAFRKDDTSEHCEKINEALNDMKADGTIEAIFEKYNSVSNSCTDEEETANVGK